MPKVKIRPTQVEKNWYIVDAKGKVLGRLAAKIAQILLGKHKPVFTPYWDLGDYVVVINSSLVRVTGKKEEQKIYYRHSGYPGGQRKETLSSLRKKKPNELIYHAVWGMLPKNRLARKILNKLFVYPKETHPHQQEKLILLG